MPEIILWQEMQRFAHLFGKNLINIMSVEEKSHKTWLTFEKIIGMIPQQQKYSH